MAQEQQNKNVTGPERGTEYLRHVRLLRRIAMVTCVAGGAALLAPSLLDPTAGFTFDASNVVAMALLFAVAVLGLIPAHRHYRLMAALMVVALSAAVLGEFYLLGGPEGAWTLTYLTAPMVVASMFLRKRHVALLAAFHLVGVSLAPYLVSELPLASLPIMYLALIDALLLVGMWHREALETARESELARGRALYSRLLETMQAGLAVVEQGRIIQVNDRFCAMLGRESEHILGDPVGKALPEWVWPDDRGRCLDGGAASQGTLHRADGTEFAAECVVSRLPGEAGHGQGWIVSLRDITETKQAEKQQRELERQLHQAQRLESIGRLAGGVAHDFNNLLLPIIGNAELCLAELEPSNPDHELIQEVLEAGQRATELTSQLLAFSRKQVLRVRIVDLNEVIAGLTKMLGRLIGEDIELATQLSATPAMVEADPRQIEQVLMNLAVNARDAMPRGGKLTFKTQADGDGAGARVVLTVSDTGHGMDQETLSRVFEPFFTTKGVGRGTGLGLATVHGILTQHGADIDVSSSPGKGTVFRIGFPLVAARSAVEAQEETAQKLPRGEGVLLVVEDEERVRGFVARVLESCGYTVLACESGPEALRLLNGYKGPLDLVISDLVMPQMDGRELAGHIRHLRPGLKVLFMSGYPEQVMSEEDAEPGSILQKPFGVRTLAQRVHETLQGP